MVIVISSLIALLIAVRIVDVKIVVVIAVVDLEIVLTDQVVIATGIIMTAVVVKPKRGIARIFNKSNPVIK